MIGKEKFNLKLQKIINQPCYIANSTEELNEEIDQNMHYISMDNELAREFKGGGTRELF